MVFSISEFVLWLSRGSGIVFWFVAEVGILLFVVRKVQTNGGLYWVALKTVFFNTIELTQDLTVFYSYAKGITIKHMSKTAKRCVWSGGLLRNAPATAHNEGYHRLKKRG